MQRRALLKLGALSAGAAAVGRALPAPAVTTVLLVTKCHLDVGFTDSQSSVIRTYFDRYFPDAIGAAAALRRSGEDRYVWTTGSWLLYEYLEQASTRQRAAMEAAIAEGDVAWHALPFNWQTEMLDRSMIEGALGFSAELDRRFGTKTTGAKMTDVPGHSRGLIAPLAAAGVRFLDIGVNAASTPPEVPEVFLWKDAAGHGLAMMYHHYDYGGVVLLPGTSVAVDVEVRTDNSGPHSPEEIAAIYRKLRARFPGAAVRAANLSQVAAAVEPIRDTLPVVTAEIGDTWIYGVGSDPVKVARYREMARLRRQWIAQGRFAVGDATDRALLAKLLLAPEHTWGTDTKRYLDYGHYRPRDLAPMLATRPYQVMERSWEEKRDDIADAVAALPGALRDEANARLAALAPKRPDTAGMQPLERFAAIETTHYRFGFDPATGALRQLENRATRQSWASPLALLTYQTLSADDYAAYQARYLTMHADWAPRDFGKPDIAKFGAESREWHPRVKRCSVARDSSEERVLLELEFADPAAVATGNVAWPGTIFYRLRMPRAEARIDLEVAIFGKQPNRMPEALWLSFAPAPVAWLLEKIDEPVEPADVVRGGGRSMHAITGDLRCVGGAGRELRIRSLDAPLVALGDRSPLNFSLDLPDLSRGVHFNLFNNAWGTNYPQWSGGDCGYRFRLFA